MIATVIKPGHAYRLADGNQTALVFRHNDARLGVLVDGTTTEELLEILIHRIATLNQGDGYCFENVSTLIHLHGAMADQKERRARLEKERHDGIKGIEYKPLGSLNKEETDFLRTGIARNFGLHLVIQKDGFEVRSVEKNGSRMFFRPSITVLDLWTCCEMEFGERT